MVNQLLDGGRLSYVDEAMEFGGHLDLIQNYDIMSYSGVNS